MQLFVIFHLLAIAAIALAVMGEVARKGWAIAHTRNKYTRQGMKQALLKDVADALMQAAGVSALFALVYAGTWLTIQ